MYQWNSVPVGKHTWEGAFTPLPELVPFHDIPRGGTVEQWNSEDGSGGAFLILAYAVIRICITTHMRA